MFFLNKRLVFMAGEAEAAISQVETDVKSKPEGYDAKTADQLVADAKGKLPTTLTPEDKKTAEGKIDAAKAKFESALALAKRAIKLKADVASVKADGDFLNAVEKVNALKTERDALKAAGMPEDTSVGTKETEINAAAKGYYDGLVSKLDKKPAKDDKYTNDELTALMTALSELQDSKYRKFPGLAEGTSTDGYLAKITEKLAIVKANADTSTDPDFKDSLKRFEFAMINLDGAEKSEASKESGHLAGAKQYMEMVLAEQEARRIWNSLPFDADPSKSWRNNSIKDGNLDPKLWTQTNLDNYTAAVQAFNKGLEKSANSAAGWSTEAKNYFKQAADLWRKLLADQQSKQKAAEDKKKEEKDTKEKVDLNASLDALAKAVGRGKGKSHDFYTKRIMKMNEDVMKIFSDEKKSSEDKKKEMDDLIAKINTECDLYDKAESLLINAVNRALAQNKKEDYTFNDTKAKVIGDYLRDPRLWAQIDPNIRTYFYNKTISGTFYIGKDKYSYNVSTTDPSTDGSVKDVDQGEGSYWSEIPANINYGSTGIIMEESIKKEQTKLAEKKFKVDAPPVAVAANDPKQKDKSS